MESSKKSRKTKKTMKEIYREYGRPRRYFFVEYMVCLNATRFNMVFFFSLSLENTQIVMNSMQICVVAIMVVFSANDLLITSCPFICEITFLISFLSDSWLRSRH